MRRQSLKSTLRDTVGAIKYFARTEAALPVRFRSPRMLLRGFHSDRRWLLPEGASRRTGYIADFPYARRAHKMNPDGIQVLFNDKIVFARALEERGLAARAPRTVGELRAGDWFPRTSWDGACIVKPARGSGGEGVRRFPALAEAIATCPLGTDYLVQEVVRQHPRSADLWAGSLNTIRVLAVRTAHGDVVLPRAVQRIGRSSTGPVDNYSSGGLVAWVDMDDGSIGPVMSKVDRPGRRLFRTHPETGAPITGRIVPCWPETMQLVRDLMDAFPAAQHVGWDMAVGEDGPLVVEGNARFVGIKLYQLHGPFTTDPGVYAYYRSYGLLP